MAKVIDMLKCYIEALMFFPKEQIYEAVWKADPEHCGAAVANVVYSLRRKIGDGYIETVVGSGYRFVVSKNIPGEQCKLLPWDIFINFPTSLLLM